MLYLYRHHNTFMTGLWPFQTVCTYSVTYTSLGYLAFRHTACIVWGRLKQNDFISAKNNPCSLAVLHPLFFPSQINSDAWSSFLIPLCFRCQYWTECDRKLSLLLSLVIICKIHSFFDLSHSAYFFTLQWTTVASFPGPRPASRRLQYASDGKLGEGLGTRLEQPYCPHPYLVSQARPTSAGNVIKGSGSNHRMSVFLIACSAVWLDCNISAASTNAQYKFAPASRLPSPGSKVEWSVLWLYELILPIGAFS